MAEIIDKCRAEEEKAIVLIKQFIESYSPKTKPEILNMMEEKHYSEAIQKRLDSTGAKIEHWEYRTLPAMRFIGLEYFHNQEDWADVRKNVTSILDTMPEHASEFDYDLTLSHHFGKKVDDERNHDFIGRFMKIDTPVPDGFVHWDFTPDDSLPPISFCSQFAFSVFAGNHDDLHNGEGFDVHAMYDITRNIILEQKITLPYPEIYWTAEVQFDRADGTIYNPENLYEGDNKPGEVRCGWLFSVYQRENE
jgi:hypothetical protein